MTHQSYILTLFNDQVDQIWEALHDSIYDTGKVEYIGSQLERCPDSRRIHWQAYVRFYRQSKQRGTWFKPHHNGIHFTPCSKERSQAIGYGTKEETRIAGPKESGTKPVAQQAFTAEDCAKCIKENKIMDIPFGYILRYNIERRLPALRAILCTEQRSSMPTFLPNPWGFILPSKKLAKRRHYWLYSRLPNKGKTYYFALPLQKDYRVALITGDTQYFNVEESTECCIFDEFNTAKFKWDTINQMCDGTYSWRRFNMPSIQLNSPLIIILSNQSINELYPHMNQFIYERMVEKEIL